MQMHLKNCYVYYKDKTQLPVTRTRRTTAIRTTAVRTICNAATAFHLFHRLQLLRARGASRICSLYARKNQPRPLSTLLSDPPNGPNLHTNPA